MSRPQFKSIGNKQVKIINNLTILTNGYSNLQINDYGKGVILTFNVSAVSGTNPTLVFQITDENQVAISAGSSPVITTPGIYKFYLYPTQWTNLGSNDGIVNGVLPLKWQLYYGVTGTTPNFNVSVVADYII